MLRRKFRTLAFCLALVAGSASHAQPTWWFQDPNFNGDRNVGSYIALAGQPAYTWYDDDVPWGTGSVVRLPEDSRYLGDVLTCVACYGGGTATMHSPYFVGADGKVFLFNHLETIYLSGTGWYNGGAVIGLTGGGTCQTGYGTFCGTSSPVSTGPHFCIETANQHAYVDFPSSYSPTSSCSYSNGTSGMANILCTNSCSQYSACGQYWWTCEADGNLHSCDSAGNQLVTNCNGNGCTVTGTCTNDVCNVPAVCKPYACGSSYYWTCEADGNIHKCDASGNPIVTACPYGCQYNGVCTDDSCKPAPSDAGNPPTDSGAARDAGTALTDAGNGHDAGAGVADSGETLEPDGGASFLDDGGDVRPLAQGGCGCATGADAGSPLGLLLVLIAGRGRRWRKGA